MSHLVDTGILIRVANVADALHAVASQATLTLYRAGEDLRTAPQNLIEFRNAATRPAAVNGIGMPPADAEAHAAQFESMFTVVPESADIYPTWKSIVQALGITGKQVHDARLVAICHVNNITHL